MNEKKARGMWRRSAGYGSAPRPAVCQEIIVSDGPTVYPQSDQAHAVWEELHRSGVRAEVASILSWLQVQRIRLDADPRDVADEYVGLGVGHQLP